MSSKDDPFGPVGRTVLKPAKAKAAAAEPTRIVAGADRTVLALPRREAPATPPSPRTVIAPTEPAASNGDRARLADLVQASGRVSYAGPNPILAAAAPTLILLGFLRQVPVDIDPERLSAELAGMLQAFDGAIARAGIGESDARVALYALCEVVDDLVPELPGVARDAWLRQGMLAHFFHAEAAGTGFFDALNRLLAAPQAAQDQLEFMHACLALGFMGQYRAVPDGQAGLDRVRRDVHETLRHYAPRPDRSLSPQWRGAAMPVRRARTRLPLWAVAAAICALLAGTYMEMRGRVTDAGEATAAALIALVPPGAPEISRVASASLAELPPQDGAEPPATDDPPVAPDAETQLDRLTRMLSAEIDAGRVSVEQKGDFVVVRIPGGDMFEPGRAALKPAFDTLVGPLAAALSETTGPVRIVGHTDSTKPTRSSQFKSNFDLSVARAKAVQDSLARHMADEVPLLAEGRGADEPLADNATAEGRIANRRVELLVPRTGPS